MVTVDFDRLAVRPGFKILDIGCGSGRHTCAAYQCRSATAIGVDLNFDDLNEARGRLQLHDRLGEHGGGIWALSAADVLNLPFRDNYFDLVICSEVLEHILPYRAAIREIVRVLQPGRNLVVSVPRYWPERICWALSTDYHTAEGVTLVHIQKTQLQPICKSPGSNSGRSIMPTACTPPLWLKCLLGPDRKKTAGRSTCITVF